MAERTTEQVPRSGRRPGFHMKPKHVGLVFCVSLVGCMVAFGAGFIVGMGYKASEQVSPYVVKRPLSAESSAQQNASGTAWEENSLTFYDTLIKNESVEMGLVAETEQASRLTSAAPARQTQPAVAEELALPPLDQPTATPETAQTPNPPPTAPTPVPVSTPALQAPVVAAAGTSPETQTLALADAASLGADASVVASYSVQVASVLTPEQAERLIEDLTRKGHHAYVHPFAAPGQPLWYRVKVGTFPNRAAAELILQELRSRETPDVFITRN